LRPNPATLSGADFELILDTRTADFQLIHPIFSALPDKPFRMELNFGNG
jgi:hypothetical protein